MSKINSTPIAIAHFRFVLIAPIIQSTFFELSAAAYF